MQKRFSLGVIGGGFMAHAILEGALKSGFLRADEIIVCEPVPSRVEDLRAQGVTICSDDRIAAENCARLLLAVKPQTFAEVAESLEGAELPIIISIMAGKTKRVIRTALGGNVKIARVMPNLPCSVGMGMAGIDAHELSEGERDFCVGLFSASGQVVEVEESLLNAVTGISGSGPAYVYLFLQGLIEAGIKQGLSAEQARTLALQTLRGGAEMVEANPEKELPELIAAVTSKGGTTFAALERFSAAGWKDAIDRAVDAAVRRSEELSQ